MSCLTSEGVLAGNFDRALQLQSIRCRAACSFHRWCLFGFCVGQGDCKVAVSSQIKTSDLDGLGSKCGFKLLCGAKQALGESFYLLLKCHCTAKAALWPHLSSR